MERTTRPAQQEKNRGPNPLAGHTDKDTSPESNEFAGLYPPPLSLSVSDPPKNASLNVTPAPFIAQLFGVLQRNPRPVTNTTVNRHTQAQIFGAGRTRGLSLEAFESYTRAQADWFAESSLTQTDRDDLWNLLLRATEKPHVLAGVRDVQVSQLRALSAAQWTNLEAFCKGCHSDTHTVRFNNPSGYTLQDRIDKGATLIALEQIISPDVLELTVSESQFNTIHASTTLMAKITAYWQHFHPHLQQTFDPAPGARGPEFQQVLNLLNSPGINPFMPLQGRVRNLHRLTVPTLNKLVQNFANTTRSKPVQLVILTGHDSSASFASDRPLLESLVTGSPNLVLILEGRDSIAGLTTEVQNIANTYGQPDAGGVHRLSQVMISGHGSSSTVELTGTGAPHVDHQRRIIDYQSSGLDTTQQGTQTFVDTVLRNLDPARARIVFNGCLVGSNPIPDHVADADIGTFIQNHPNLKTFVENRASTLGLAMPANFVQGARASLGALTSLRDRAGNLRAVSTDPTIFGDAATYAATGHEPEGVMTSAVEVAATNPVLAADKLRARQRQGINPSEEWWDQCTISFVNVAMDGVTTGNPVNLARLRKLSHMVTTPFLARWTDFGITVQSFVHALNSVDAALAGAIYRAIDTPPMTVYRTPPDQNARLMRLMFEQARIGLGENRIAQLTSAASLFAANLAVDSIERKLDTSVIGSQSPAIFAQSVSTGLIRLALAWLQADPTNSDMRTFLTREVSTSTPRGSTTPVSTVSARVMAQAGTRTQREILEALGLLTATAPPSGSTSTPSDLANAQGPGSADNNLFLRPGPARRMAFLALGTTTPVFREPNPAAPQLGVLNPADEINVTGTTGAFSAVDFNGQLGFVRTSDLF